MIRPLRIAHRIAWTTLAVALPAIISAALLARQPLRPESHMTSITGTKQSSRAGIFYVRREGNVLLLTARGGFAYPDALAYWSPDAETVSDKSKFLGPFVAGSVNRFEVGSEAGNVVLYTPARKTVIDSASLGGPQ